MLQAALQEEPPIFNAIVPVLLRLRRDLQAISLSQGSCPYSLLSAGMVAMRLNAALGCTSSAALLFESPTIAQIANELAGQAGMAIGSAPPPALEAIPVAPFSPEQRQAGLPCSFNQEQMIAISMQPSGLAYNQFFVFELAGMVNADMLQDSLDVLVSRHEALRTCFRMTPAGPQQLVLPAGKCGVQLVERQQAATCSTKELLALQGWAPEWLSAMAADERLVRYNMDEAPLMRAILVHQDGGKSYLLMCSHHSIMDGWSSRLFVSEMEAAHSLLQRGFSAETSPNPLQYVDFSQWQRSQLTSGAWGPQVNYWREQLEGIPSLLELPTSKMRPTEPSGQAFNVPFVISGQLFSQMKSVSSNLRASPTMLLIAAFQVGHPPPSHPYGASDPSKHPQVRP